MMRRVYIALALAFVNIAFACSEEPTIIVSFDVRPEVWALDTLTVTVAGAQRGSTTQTFELEKDVEFPLTLAVLPQGRQGELSITAEGKDSAGVSRARGTNQFQIGDVDSVTVLLAPMDFAVNSVVTGRQRVAREIQGTGRQLAVDSNGGFMAVWESGTQVVARLFAPNTVPTENAVAKTTAEFPISSAIEGSEYPAIARGGDGYLVVWEHATNSVSYRELHATLVSPTDASPIGMPNRVIARAAEKHMRLPTVVGLEDGNFLVTWLESAEFGFGDSSGTPYVRLLGRDGVPMGDPIPLTAPSVESWVPHGAALTNGNFVVTWGQAGSDRFPSPVVQVFAPTTAPVTPVLPVAVQRSESYSPQVAALPNGGFAISWLHDSEKGLYLALRLFDADGVPTSTEMKIGDVVDLDRIATLAVQAKDGAIAAVYSDGNKTSGDHDVYLRLFHPTGMPAGPIEKVNTLTQGRQSSPSVESFGADSYLVSWTDASEAGEDSDREGIRARVIYRSLTRRDGSIGAQCTGPADCSEPLTCAEASDQSRLCHEPCDLAEGTPCANGGVCTSGVCRFDAR